MSTEENVSTEDRLRHFLKQLTLDLRQTKQRLSDYEARDIEPLAIVGMSCRLPGGVLTPDDLWQLVSIGTDAVAGFPADRGWDVEGIYDPSGERPGTTRTREGGFLYGAAEFDAEFFGISPREALGMDPQQRLLLETAWEALEYAGIDPAGLRSSRTSVYVGAATQGYGFDVQGGGIGVEGYGITGVSTSLLSGRIAYALGLEGAAVTIDTACSSSLVALHLAGQSLRRGESDLALVGGAAVMAKPSVFVEFSRQGGLAPDGRCKSFADGADGTGWAEGVGFLVVERLSDARRLGHEVLARLRGSAVNQDGASNGLTAPNGTAQQRVILDALISGGLRPGDVDMVEGHGTGTKLGDPVEAGALLATYGQERDQDDPLWLGSLKSNIGHTQAAAGVAGVIKTIEAMRHNRMPQTLHANTPTSSVDWSTGAVELLTEPRDWPHRDRPRRAAVSAFGISGTNAHIILEQAEPESVPVPEPDDRSDATHAFIPLVLSGKTADAARGQAAALRTYLSAHPDIALADVARSLVTGRTLFEHRVVVVGKDGQEVAKALSAVHPIRSGPGRLGAVFSGQGAQRTGMGRELAERFPVFAQALEETFALTDPLLGRSLKEVMWSSSAELLERTEFAQPALFAFEVAMARLWMSWGVRFSAISGHSVGEIAAAVVAGILSLQDAARLVVARGQLMQSLSAGGAMVAIAASEAEVAVMVEGAPDVAIAAVNGPGAVVVSGAEAEVLRVGEYWREQGRRTTRLQVSHAFHSPLMEPMLEEFTAVVAGLTFTEAAIAVSPAAETDQPFATPGYWVEHARRAVRFADAVERMTGTDVLVEIGPDAALVPMLGGERPAIAASRRNKSEVRTVLEGLGTAHAHGVEVDWPALLSEGKHVALPTYAFQHQSYWLAVKEAGSAAASSDDSRFWTAVEQQDLHALTDTLGAPAELGPALPALARWYSEDRHRRTLDSWRYRVVWRPAAEPVLAAQVSGSWLVVLPVEGGAKVAARLRALTRKLADVVTVEIGSDRGEAAAALREAGNGLALLSGVISLIDQPEALLVLVQALGDAAIGARLWCLTQEAVATGDGEAPRDAHAAASWGLGRVVSLEHPDRWGGLIDLPAKIDDRVSGWLAGILAGDGHEDQLAVRSGGVWRRRIEPAPAGPALRAWEPTGTVLITGGTGSIGASVARWLAAESDCSIVLLSRRGPEAPGAGELARELENSGAKVRVVAADVADRDQMSELITVLAEEGEPVRAVFHAAGIGQSTALAEMTAREFRTVISAKIDGAQMLDDLLADTALDAFVLFSSISGVWGSSRYAAYAAGNAYLDALAEQRRARGRSATAIAWGVWEDSGMVSPSGELQLRRRGLVPMPMADGITMLRQVLDREETVLSIVDVEWEPFVAGYTAARQRPLIEDLPQVKAVRTKGAAAPVTRQTDIRQTLAGLPPADRASALEDLVRVTVADVFGHTDTAAVAGEQPFVELGIDSLSAVEIRNRLRLATGLVLPAMLVYDHPTVVDVRAFLEKALVDGGSDRAPAVAAETASGEDFAAIYRGVALRGNMTEVEALLSGAASLRTRFTDARDVDSGFVRLATGDEGPALICFPPFAPVEQSLQFARLAVHFRGRRDLSMVRVPGFQPDTPLADSVATLVAVLAEATLRCAGEKAFALLGYSSSGWLAQAVATSLEASGSGPTGVVLLDTYLPDSMPLSLRRAMTYEVNERRARFTTMNFATLTALGAYRQLFRSWTPQAVAAPTLFVTPEDCIPGDPAAPPITEDWRAYWPLHHTAIRIPGDHCTIVAEHADKAAVVINDWLAGAPDTGLVAGH